MQSGDFIWDDDDQPNGNVVHIAQHGATPTEAEDAVLDPDRVPTPASRQPGERRFGIIGATGSGRILVVVFVVRDGAIRVITAYSANEQQKRQYRRHR